MDLVDYIIGIFMYKVYRRDVPKLFEIYNIENHNIHDLVTRQINYIHIAQADTNRHNVFMRIQVGKVWNLIVKRKIPYNESINMFKRKKKIILVELLYIMKVQYFLLKLYRWEYC